MIVTRKELGFPARPVNGGEWDGTKTLAEYELARPKLNGNRVLMNQKGEVYNRHGLPYTKMGEQSRREIFAELYRMYPAPEYSDIIWWDLEYIPSGRSSGVAVVIDVVIEIKARDRKPNPDFYERQLRYDHFPRCDPEHHPDWIPNVEQPVWRFTTYRNSMCTSIIWDAMKRTYHRYVEFGRKNEYLWEGVVVQRTDDPYELTEHQSTNMHLQTKYRFN
mgnify:CR=1 FL=1